MSLESMQLTLKTLRLSGMANNLVMRYQEAKSNELDYLEFLDNLISDEQTRRQSNLLDRRLKIARFPELKTIDGFDFNFNPVIKKRDVKSLSSCAFVYKAQNVLFVGPPGVGKSHLAIALGVSAVHSGYSVCYRSAFDFFQDLHEADINGTRKQYIKTATAVNLLIIDEFGMKKMPSNVAEDMLEIIHRRYQHSSTIIATNRVVSDWGAILGDNPSTAAVLDRFLDSASVFNIKGKSYRLKNTKRKEGD